MRAEDPTALAGWLLHAVHCFEHSLDHLITVAVLFSNCVDARIRPFLSDTYLIVVLQSQDSTFMEEVIAFAVSRSYAAPASGPSA